MRKQLTLTLAWALAWALGLTLALGACGSGGLSPEEVTKIPPGDAVGKALSGLYTVELTTTACSGTCPVFGSGLLKVSVCEVGYRFGEVLTVTQDNGRLEIKLPLGYYGLDLVGGVGANGAFDAGGVAAQSGGTVQVTSRARGAFSGNGVSGEDRTQGAGSADGTPINCIGTYAFTGSRK